MWAVRPIHAKNPNLGPIIHGWHVLTTFLSFSQGKFECVLFQLAHHRGGGSYQNLVRTNFFKNLILFGRHLIRRKSQKDGHRSTRIAKNLVGTNLNRPKGIPLPLLITSGGLGSLVSAVGSKKRIQHSTATNFLTKKNSRLGSPSYKNKYMQCNGGCLNHKWLSADFKIIVEPKNFFFLLTRNHMTDFYWPINLSKGWKKNLHRLLSGSSKMK